MHKLVVVLEILAVELCVSPSKTGPTVLPLCHKPMAVADDRRSIRGVDSCGRVALGCFKSISKADQRCHRQRLVTNRQMGQWTEFQFFVIGGLPTILHFPFAGFGRRNKPHWVRHEALYGIW